jgi:FkbM family methyltransferase
VRQLATHETDVVLDVGANVGQFAQRLREAGFGGRIVSFEASGHAHSVLREKACRDRNWIVARQMALGDRNGTLAFNLAGNSESSSALPMLPSHLGADPKSRYIGTETVELRTLDSVAEDYVNGSDRVFLKLDVQGFEYQVLQGAERLLDNVTGIQCELSLVPLYDGERLFDYMLHELENCGFEIWSLTPGLINTENARLLQVDAVFFRCESDTFQSLSRNQKAQSSYYV